MTRRDPKGHKEVQNAYFQNLVIFSQKPWTNSLEKSRFLDKIQIFF